MGDIFDYVDELLSPAYLADTGYFNPKAVSMLVKKCRQNQAIGFRDNMAIVGIISTLLVHELFIKKFDTNISDRGLSVNEELHVTC